MLNLCRRCEERRAAHIARITVRSGAAACFQRQQGSEVDQASPPPNPAESGPVEATLNELRSRTGARFRYTNRGARSKSQAPVSRAGAGPENRTEREQSAYFTHCPPIRSQRARCLQTSFSSSSSTPTGTCVCSQPSSPLQLCPHTAEGFPSALIPSATHSASAPCAG